jgi:thiosulfate/3-mercaptopyruvate sulfurtransferase
MKYQTIISANELHEMLNLPDLAILDCRFYLPEPEQGYQEYLDSHIPGAVYVNLDKDLSGEMISGKTGRHPLPDIKVFAGLVSSWGIDSSTQVIAYDNMGGALAARLWWMLRWLGHDKVAVLDGGWKAWISNEFSIETDVIKPERKSFVPQEQPGWIADIDFVDKVRLDPDYLLVDARSPERYWGLKETIDVKAGHIPGAVTAPYVENLDKDEYFLPVEQLKERYQNLLGGIPEENVIVYCGSGVTSIHSMIAMVMAGYDLPKLYPGSWSEWSADDKRPIAP